MRLTVSHTTSYRFDPPMRGISQSLRIWPSLFDGQSVLDWSVTISGATRGASFRDGAGDLLETATVLGPVEQVDVIMSGTVDTVDTTGVLKNHVEKVNPLAYLRTTAFTRADHDLKTLAKDAVSGLPEHAAIDRAHALSKAVRAAIDYVPGETTPDTTAAEALAAGHGVCQDHAHALIAAAIAVDIPARYVTGYLYLTAEDQSADASHAWAELYVEDLGWVGFDAANAIAPNEHYIRLGSGFDARDAAPIRGVAQGAGSEDMHIDVSVEEAAQQ